MESSSAPAKDFPRQIGSGKAVKRTKPYSSGGNESKKNTNKVDRLMEGIKERLYGINVEDSKGHSTPNTSSSNSSAAPSPPHSSCHVEEDVTVEEFDEDLPPPSTSCSKSSDSQSSAIKKTQLSGLKMVEQQKILQDFNPRNSARMRRKYNRVMDYNDNPKPAKIQESLIHDYKGRFIAYDRSTHDVCDCLVQGCPGCHFPCPKCRSPKCGAECRSCRKWFYERVDVEGTDQHFVNKFTKG